MRSLLAIVAVLLIGPHPPGQDTSADDIAIYKAVIDHTIRPAVVRTDTGAGIPTPTVLVVNRTLAVCQPEQRRPFFLACLSIENIQDFEKPLRNGSVIFDGLVTASIRADLAKSLLSRNDRNYSFPSLGFDDLLLADPEHINGVLYRVPRITRGYASFSRPAHSGQGQALVYATYVSAVYAGTAGSSCSNSAQVSGVSSRSTCSGSAESLFRF
jgi:hypothetical protein